jgi:hypothetical protein
VASVKRLLVYVHAVLEMWRGSWAAEPTLAMMHAQNQGCRWLQIYVPLDCTPSRQPKQLAAKEKTPIKKNMFMRSPAARLFSSVTLAPAVQDRSIMGY